MIVLIPSYKRTEVLENVVKSVLKCDINGINERILILIVNFLSIQKITRY